MDLLNSPDFSKHVDQILDGWHTPGVSISLVQDGTVNSKGLGKACLNPPQDATPDTLYDIASCSKSLTAAAVALLVADDEKYPQVQWDSKMSDLLPEDFVMAEARYTAELRVGDILSHRTGLPGHDSSYLNIYARNPDTPKDVTRMLRDLPITAPIRTKFMYSNMMFTVATHLIETITGQTFEHFLHENFFTPLNMTSTHLQPTAAIKAGLESRLWTPYCWVSKRKELKAVEREEAPGSQGAGSIITSSVDYLKWVQALMNQEGPITEEIYKDLVRSRTICDPDGIPDELNPWTSQNMYALGLEVFWYRGYRIIKHDGQIAGSGGMHFFLPEQKLGGVILANSDDASTVGDILAMELIDEAIGVPEKEREDWNAVEHKRYQKYEDEQVKGDELKKRIWPDYDGRCEDLTVPMERYVGQYWSDGYRGMIVTEKEGKLVVECADRGMGMTLEWEHICDQRKFVVRIVDWPSEEADEVEGEFVFDESGENVVRMGLAIEEEMEGMIWFDRVG